MTSSRHGKRISKQQGKMMKNKKCNWPESYYNYYQVKLKKMKLKQRLLGFFHKLRFQRMIKKQHQQQGKLRSMKSIHHQTCCTSPLKSGSKCPQSSNSLVATKQGKVLLISNTTTPMPLVKTNNYPMILKKHGEKKKERSIYDVPEELWAEILVRLPVKYILRCSCVRKSWYYLIKTPMFITLQLNYQKKVITHSLNPKFLFFENVYTNVLTLRFDDVQCQEYCTLKCPPGLPKVAWHAPSYGLVCTSTMPFPHRYAKPEIYLWNPLVQKYKTLPDSPLPFRRDMWKALAFGFVPEFNDYFVVHFVKPRLLPVRGDPDPHSVIIGVYSLKTNSWKIIRKDNVFIRYIRYEDTVFVNGAAFWVGVKLDGRKIVMCFDTKTDILREISMPCWVANMRSNPVIHLFGQSIAYFVWDGGFDFFDMWILKYNSINEFSWEKKMNVCPSEGTWVEVLGVRNSGEPIVAKSYNLISYNLDNHEANDFVDSWDRWTPYPYYEEGFAPPFFIRPFVESLVLLDID